MGKNNEPGKAIYVDGRGTTDHIRFLYNTKTRVFDAWHEESRSYRFTMTPVLVGRDIVGLDVQFSDIHSFVAHFALEIQDDDEDVEVYDVLAPPVYLAELIEAGF